MELDGKLGGKPLAYLSNTKVSLAPAYIPFSISLLSSMYMEYLHALCIPIGISYLIFLRKRWRFAAVGAVLLFQSFFLSALSIY